MKSITFLSSLFFALQMLLLNFYSFYGFYKSVNEYFCINSRLSSFTSVDESKVIASFYFFLPDQSITLSVEREKLYLTKGEERFQLDGNNFTWAVPSLKVEETVGYLSFSYDVYADSTFLHVKCNSNGENGTLVAGYSPELGLMLVDNVQSTEGMTCTIYRTPEDCTIPIAVTNKFLIVFLIMASCVVLGFFLTLLNFNRHITLRIFKKILNLFTIKEIWGTFCNPITGESITFNQGDYYNVLTQNDGNEVNYVKGNTFHLTDKDGSYNIYNNKLSIVKNGKTDIIDLNEESLMKITNYFDEILFDPRCCIVENEHFIKTSSVLYKLAAGFKVKKVKSLTTMVCNDVYESDLMAVQKQYPIKKKTLLFLLEHNARFFKKPNFSALYNCLSGNSSYQYRPEDVNNSSWKFYGSDYYHIISSMSNIKPFRQVKWEESKCLKNMMLQMQEDEDFIKVVKDTQDIQIKFSKEDFIEEYEGKALKDFKESIMDFKKPSNEQNSLIRDLKNEPILLEFRSDVIEIGEDLNNKIKQFTKPASYKEKLEQYREIVDESIKNYQDLLIEKRDSLINDCEIRIKTEERRRVDKREIEMIEKFYESKVAPTNRYSDAYRKFKSKPEEVQKLLFTTVFNKELVKTDLNRLQDLKNNRIKKFSSDLSTLEKSMFLLRNRFEILSDLNEESEEIVEQKIPLNDILTALVKKCWQEKKRKQKKKNSKRRVSKSSGIKYKSPVLNSPISENLEVLKDLLHKKVNKLRELNLDKKGLNVRLIHLMKFAALKVNNKRIKNMGLLNPEGKFYKLMNKRGLWGKSSPLPDEKYALIRMSEDLVRSLSDKIENAENECNMYSFSLL